VCGGATRSGGGRSLDFLSRAGHSRSQPGCRVAALTSARGPGSWRAVATVMLQGNPRAGSDKVSKVVSAATGFWVVVGLGLCAVWCSVSGERDGIFFSSELLVTGATISVFDACGPAYGW
jgi:hypothetical protein